MTDVIPNLRRPDPLPVTIVAGMPVIDMTGSNGVVAGITQAYCIYWLDENNTLCVANWRDVALANICPAAPLLPSDIEENDRRNASAAVLGELLALERLGPLTPTQTTLRDELLADLCGRSPEA